MDFRFFTGKLWYYADIKGHPFFAGLDWDALERLEVEPPFKPRIESETDLTNFDSVCACGVLMPCCLAVPCNLIFEACLLELIYETLHIGYSGFLCCGCSVT